MFCRSGESLRHGFLVKSFGECCASMVFLAASLAIKALYSYCQIWTCRQSLITTVHRRW